MNLKALPLYAVIFSLHVSVHSCTISGHLLPLLLMLLCLLLSPVLGITYIFSCCEVPPIWPSFRQWASSPPTVICPGIQPHLSTCTPKVCICHWSPFTLSFTLFSFLYSQSSYRFQHCFICRPLDFTVSEDAGSETMTFAALH